MNESLRYYEVQNVLPEKLKGLSDDLLAYWDEHYPSSKFPPPENYKNAKIDIESNRVVSRHDFLHDMHYVQELVNVFEHLFKGLEVQLVWFIKKRRRGDGFQRWHQDLVANATTAATIVVNIDSILAGDESYFIEQIRESHRIMEEVSANTTASNNENESERGKDQAPDEAASGPNDENESEQGEDRAQNKTIELPNDQKDRAQNKTIELPNDQMTTACPDEAEETMSDNKGKQHKSGEMAEVVNVASYRFNTADKTKPLGTVDSTANKAPLPDPDDRKHPPESVNEVIENLVIASKAMDIDNRKRPPEIANEVMDIVVVTTEAVDMHNQDYEWKTDVIVANVETPPSKVSHSSNVAKPPVPPSLPTMEDLRGIWICEHCDYHCDATKKRCSKCRKWRHGRRDNIGHGKNVKPVPNQKQKSTAGRKRKDIPPATVVAITGNNGGDSLGGISYSPLTGANSFIDETVTDGDSLQTNNTTTRERDDDELIEILDLEDSKMRGDGGDSDAKGDGYDIAQSFVDGMVEVERERYNADGFQIEREVECDDQTAVEG